MTIQIYIERIILDGFELAQRERPLLETAVTIELTRLLAENGLNYHANIALPSRMGTDIQQNTDNTAAQFGSDIARSIYGGLTQ